MANPHNATDYTANGPSAFGFRTGGPNFTEGVVAFGKETGVHGLGGNPVEGGSGKASIGVWGESAFGYGVKGTSRNFPAVLGEARPDEGVPGVGVQGTGTTGVEGVAIGRGNLVGVYGSVFDGNDTGIGVHGKCGGGKLQEAGTGIGVFGENVKGLGVVGKSDSWTAVLGQSISGWGVHGVGKIGVQGEGQGNGDLVGVHGTCNKEGFTGIGVYGENERGLGVRGRSNSFTAVLGQSISGWGVHGSSESSYGGVFRSEGSSYGGVFASNFAQIRLEPAASRGPPTGHHVKGEFFVDATGALFYCFADGAPASWKKLAGP